MSILKNIFNQLLNPTPTTSTPGNQSIPTAPPANNSAPSTAKKHNVTGVSYYEKNLLKLAAINPAYSLNAKAIIVSNLADAPIYQYCFSPIKTELIPEPTNPHDPNAIKVIVDGEHVGYIKAGSCSRLLKLISENRIERIDCKISGGSFKLLSICGDGGEYEIEKGKENYKINVFVTEK